MYWLSEGKIFSNEVLPGFYDALAFIFYIGVLFFLWEESSKRSLRVGRQHGRRVKLVLQTGFFQIPP